MKNFLNKDIQIFMDKLKERNIPVILEQDEPVVRKIFYKLPNCIWSGIYVLKDDEKNYPSQKYCELILVERAGIITTGLYDKQIKEEYWEVLVLTSQSLSHSIKNSSTFHFRKNALTPHKYWIFTAFLLAIMRYFCYNK